MYAFSSQPFGFPQSDDFLQLGTPIPQPDGTFTLQWAPAPASGNPQTVLSVQRNGTYETRPIGTAGWFEKLRLSGNDLIVQPDGPGTRAYVIAARGVA